MILWRAAPHDRPYFGRGSFWTPEEDFAACFAEWASSHPELGHHVVYRAHVEITRLLTYADPISADVVSAAAGMLAAEGYQWVSFTERGSTDGLSPRMARLVRTCAQYVYLGAEPIKPD